MLQCRNELLRASIKIIAGWEYDCLYPAAHAAVISAAMAPAEASMAPTVWREVVAKHRSDSLSEVCRRHVNGCFNFRRHRISGGRNTPGKTSSSLAVNALASFIVSEQVAKTFRAPSSEDSSGVDKLWRFILDLSGKKKSDSTGAHVKIRGKMEKAERIHKVQRNSSVEMTVIEDDSRVVRTELTSRTL